MGYQSRLRELRRMDAACPEMSLLETLWIFYRIFVEATFPRD